MKTTILTLIVIAGIYLLIPSCSKQRQEPVQKDTAVVVMKDYTDSLLARPEPEVLKGLYDLRQNIWNGGSFRYVTLSDVDYANVYETNIEQVGLLGQLTGNEIKRMGKVERYYNDIDTIFKEVQSQSIGRNYSALFSSIGRELNNLSNSKAQRKIALIYSNLFENNAVFSLYNPIHLQLLKTDPDSVKAIFQEQAELHDLSGIEIYIIYQPQSQRDNEWFKQMSGLYRSMLETKGARVEVSANLLL